MAQVKPGRLQRQQAGVTKKRKGDPKEGYRYPLGNIIYRGNGKEDGNYYIILGVI